MWSFFGLLFFGMYYLYKKIEDDVATDVNDTLYEKAMACHEKIQIDAHKEHLLYTEFREDRRIFIKELDKIDADMMYIFGEDWHNIIEECRDFNSLYQNPVGIAYNVYLAYLGYVEAFTINYSLMGWQYFYQKFRGLQVMEKYMKAAHPDLDLELIVCPRTDVNRHGKVVYDNNICNCEVHWKHMLRNPHKEYARCMRKLSEIDIDEIEVDF